MNIYKSFRNPSTGEVLHVVYDNDAENPRAWESNVGAFIVDPRCRYVDNEGDIALDLACRDDDAAALDKNPDIIAYLPVYVYDHSGARMNTTGFSCPWDSGQIGWIVATRENLRRAWITWSRITEKRRECLRRLLRGEVETYSAYVSGEVYGFIVENAAGDELDSCYGYYGGSGLETIRADHPEFTEEIA